MNRAMKRAQARKVQKNAPRKSARIPVGPSIPTTRSEEVLVPSFQVEGPSTPSDTPSSETSTVIPMRRPRVKNTARTDIALAKAPTLAALPLVMECVRRGLDEDHLRDKAIYIRPEADENETVSYPPAIDGLETRFETSPFMVTLVEREALAVHLEPIIPVLAEFLRSKQVQDSAVGGDVVVVVNERTSFRQGGISYRNLRTDYKVKWE